MTPNPGERLPASPIDAFLSADGTPNWDRIDFDVLCPRCGYNLRTLSTPRCTECGLDFEWRRLLDRSAWRSDFLFEHHWRTRPLRSFVKTVALGFRPRRFWQRVSLQEHVVRGPLYFLLLISPLILLLVLHGGAWILSQIAGWLSGVRGPAMVISPAGMASPTFNAALVELYGAYSSLAQAPILGGIDYVVWVFLSIVLVFGSAFLLLSGLRQTLGKCKVRAAHILRVVAYSAIPICALIAVIILIEFGCIPVVANAVRPASSNIVAVAVIATSIAQVIFVILIMTAWLSAGLRYYAKLPRPRILAFTATFVALLTLFTAFAFITAWVI